MRFTDITQEVGITYEGRTLGAAVGDLNGDLADDIFIGNHDREVTNTNPPTVSILQNNLLTDGTFPEVSASTIEDSVNKGGDNHTQSWIDFDNDGDQDLYLPDHGRRFEDQFYVNDNGFLKDKAQELGLVYEPSKNIGSLFLDYNQDGLIDIMTFVNNNSDSPPTLFRQDPNGGFTDVGAQIIPEIQNDWINGTLKGNINYATLSDFNGDGKHEVILAGGRRIFETSPDGFTDITGQFFNRPLSNSGEDSVVGDFNGDLLPDLYVTTNGIGFRDLLQTSPTEFDFNSIRPLGTELGFEFNTSGLVTFRNTDGDLPRLLKAEGALTKIFIGSSGINPTTVDFTLDPSNPDFEGILPHQAGVDDGIYIGYDASVGRWTFLASGDPDILELSFTVSSTEEISNLNSINFEPAIGARAATERLYLNEQGTLVESSRDAGLRGLDIAGKSVTSGDFDNDMDLDLFIVTVKGITNTPDVLLENQGDGTFVAVENGGGAAGAGLSEGQGDTVVSSDFNLDGFIDLFVTNGVRPREFNYDGPYKLFKNEGNGNSWLQLALQGVESNRDGIGATVYATAGGIKQIREQDGGIHSKAQDSKLIHFGLAQFQTVETLDIRWDSGMTQVHKDVAANQLLRTVEGIGFDTDDVMTGNDADNILEGKDGNDWLEGGLGADSLDGGAGNDTAFYGNSAAGVIIKLDRNSATGGEATGDQLTGIENIVGSSSKDKLIGDDEDNILEGGDDNDRLVGKGGNDRLIGGEGGDFLVGGSGNDILTGGQGRDKFRFNSPRWSGVDTILDFESATDLILIQGRLFGGDLTRGLLSEEQFTIGSSATSADQRFIYNQGTGQLFFDQDGSGSESQTLFAILDNQADMVARDIRIL